MVFEDYFAQNVQRAFVYWIFTGIKQCQLDASCWF